MNEDLNVKTNPSRPAAPKKKRGKGGNLILIIAVIAALGLFAWAEMQRRETTQQLQQTKQELEEIQRSTQRSGQEIAREVLDKVTKHIRIDTEPEPTVATITDIDALRLTNEFYNKAENGDHLIITETRAVLYDPEADIVLDVVPVVIQPEPGAEAPATDGEATEEEAAPEEPAAEQPGT